MKILLDANLSWRLSKQLMPTFPQILHVERRLLIATIYSLIMHCRLFAPAGCSLRVDRAFFVKKINVFKKGLPKRCSLENVLSWASIVWLAFSRKASFRIIFGIKAFEGLKPGNRPARLQNFNTAFSIIFNFFLTACVSFASSLPMGNKVLYTRAGRYTTWSNYGA